MVPWPKYLIKGYAMIARTSVENTPTVRSHGALATVLDERLRYVTDTTDISREKRLLSVVMVPLPQYLMKGYDM